jgi:outer membrane protein assembly factor BamD (BamD/ComL family)
MKLKLILVAALGLFAIGARAAVYQRGAMAHAATIYISPDRSSAKLGEIGRGREVIILEISREWLHVEALLSEAPRGEEEGEASAKTITGWLQDKGVVRASTANGDKILYGEAIDSEEQASQRHGRRGAGQDAMYLYHRVYDYFPNSPLAAEALYRFADIKWQLDRQDVMAKPSAREQEAFLRGEIDDHWMKEVMKKFPGTKWADRAAFHLIENKLCGEWQGASKCPTKEADIYEKYAVEHPQSPAAPEALYAAAWRWAALIEIYKTEEQPKKSEESKGKAVALAQKVISQYGQTAWEARAQRLLYLVQQGIPTYGNAVD